jgi:hypothetical protein
MSDLTTFTIGLFEKIDGWISPQVSSLEKRVDALEKSARKSLADCHRGTFSENTQYQRGDLLTHSGGLWLAKTATTYKPGQTSDWQLIVKRGSQ